MSSVNKTENYGLSQFSANDQPTWMGDYSGDMQKIDTALGNSAKRTSDKFSESLPYAAGAYCIKDDLLYKFKSAKSAGAWDASKVQATTVMSELTGLTEKILVPDYGNASLLYSTLQETQITYTAAANGYIVGSGYGEGQATSYIYASINNIMVGAAQGTADETIGISFPVKKGDVISWRFCLSKKNNGIYFVPVN